jgi:hypothetical protein
MSSTKEQPWRKYNTNMVTPNGGKVSAYWHSQEAVELTATSTGNKTVATDAEIKQMSKGGKAKAPPQKARRQVDDEPLNLETATVRRVDWTPPAQKQEKQMQPSQASILNDVSSSIKNEENVFGSLLEAYGCQDLAHTEAVTISGDDSDSSFLKKRKLIELLPGNDTLPKPPAARDSPSKPKAPKKARTITELATAMYRVQAEEELPLPTTVVTEETQRTGVAEDDTGDNKGKGKGKGKGKAKPRKKPVKKAKPPKTILLSPASALQHVAKQDFVFGTSSQLAREQSPTLLCDIQQAIKASMEHCGTDSINLLSSDPIEAPKKRGMLWNAAARDIDGDLFNVELVDLAADSPQLVHKMGDEPFGYSRLDSPAMDTDKRKIPDSIEASFETLSDILPPPARPQQVEIEDSESPSTSSQISISSDMRKSDHVPRKGREMAAAIHTTLVESVEKASVVSESNAPSIPQRPSYELYTDAQLAREIRSYGFKQVKRRANMITLLDQCWKSKHPITLGGIGSAPGPSSIPGQIQTITTRASAPAVSPKKPRGRPRKNSPTATEASAPPASAQMPAESPKKPRGRPKKIAAGSAEAKPARLKKTSKPLTKKASLATTSPTKRSISPSTPKRKKATPTVVFEIPDSMSEAESSGSASPFSSPESCSTPPAVDLSLSMEKDSEISLTISPNDDEAALFSKINEAITTAPRTMDPAQPSWHEKILLYDPIILEDLTSWLNSGQLTRVGHDNEVYPGQVKSWCESKSVCCLWKVNLRGKERKRY